MNEKFSRFINLIGTEKFEKLSNSRVAVFGIGGVGGYAVEALVRAGVGSIDLVDSDTVDITNLNRQIIATEKTIGRNKVDACEERILEINPQINVLKHNIFYSDKTASEINLRDYDYVIDAIDSVTSKILLIEECVKNNIPIISSMGTGNKLEASMLEVADISKTSVCPLARVIRYELKKRGISHLKVVYSKEKPIEKVENVENKRIPASSPFVPACAGMILAGEVIKNLIDIS
ncbi:MAG: tRNA threonylcarbamoyladenosine dehydratase [Ruminococcaceae bacterium]|nr:tRNA threonylcarbamoyladenosine dehydratase [Oscillospiraceae bacterium]